MRPLFIISMSVVLSMLMVGLSIYATRAGGAGFSADRTDVSVRNRVKDVHSMQATATNSVVQATDNMGRVLKAVSSSRREKLRIEDVLDPAAIQEMQKLQKFMVPVQYVDNGALTLIPWKGRAAMQANGGGPPLFPIPSIKNVMYAQFDTERASGSISPAASKEAVKKSTAPSPPNAEDPLAFNDIEVGIFTSVSGGDGG